MRASGLWAAVMLWSGCSNEMSGARADADDVFDATDADFDASPEEDWDTDVPEAPEASFADLAPAQADVYVLVASPERDTVTRIRVADLRVDTVAVGRMPTVVRVTDDYARAVVLNRGEDTVTVLDTATLESRTIPIRQNMNQVALSPGGRWAVAFHDELAVRDDDPPPVGVQSFNEVSLVDTLTGAHTPMVVGYDPKAVRFTPDGETAVIVADESLAVIDLTAPVLSAEIVEITDNLVAPPPAEEVALAPSGRYAFVRQFGASDLAVVDMRDLTVRRVSVGENPTDLDLTPDGSRAAVVARGSQQVWMLDAEDPFAPADVVDLPSDALLGSLQFAPDGATGVLYTTANASDVYATWRLNDDAVTLRSLVKPVANVAISPTGGTLLMFHDAADAPDADPSSPFKGAPALSVIDLRDFRSNPMKLPSKVSGFANSDDGARGYFTLKDRPLLEVLDYQTLIADEISLGSDAVFVGVLPDLDPADGASPKAWVSQEHSLGRISFYEPADASLETITGFELNARIEE